MRKTACFIECGLSVSSKFAALAALAVALSVNCISASAEEPQGAPASVHSARINAGDLEKAFWICDHAASRRRIAAGQAALCFAVTEEFKRLEFGGDSEKLLEWWQWNKVAQHAKLDAGYSDGEGR